MWALALLAVFSNVTAVERIISVWRTTERQSAEAAGQINRKADQQDTRQEDRQQPMAAATNDVRDSDIQSVRTSVPPFTGGVPE